MSADDAMRLRLQQVADYRRLCQEVRRSGRWNVLFAGLILLFTYLQYEAGLRGWLLVLYGGLAAGELLVGLYKWLAPSAEGALLDGLVLLAFVGFNGWRQYERVRAGARLDPVSVLISLLVLSSAAAQFQEYGRRRRQFADRPTREHMAWFADLESEVRAADPQADELALDLPTAPHWRAKLLGTTAVLVSARGGEVWVAGPDEVELLREKTDHGTGRRKARLTVCGVEYPEFEVADATWSNYQRWRAGLPAPAPAV
ncbi:MAG: hypothetical protein C0501_01325 [Isosphaera sp.]|nr:hypothetical protein [Isosphaera sp.]